jgi:hypothetical protein
MNPSESLFFYDKDSGKITFWNSNYWNTLDALPYLDDGNDLDDDNDGILDVDEVYECENTTDITYASQDINGNYKLMVYTSGIADQLVSPIQGYYVNGSQTFNTGNITSEYITINDNDSILHDDVQSGGGIEDSNGGQSIVENFGLFNQNDNLGSAARVEITNNTTATNGSLYIIRKGSYFVYATNTPINSGDNITYTTSNNTSIQYPIFAVGQVHYDSLIESFITNICVNNDVDNDGIPNHLDHDSDNDGINDALEAGFTDNDLDGEVDGDGYDNDGKVTNSDGYTTPNDLDNNNIYDFLETN